MFGQPRYHNYSPNTSYNPYLHSSYQRPSPFEAISARSRELDQERVMQDRARALAEQRARRSQYLPDEDDDDDDDWEYNQLGPRERAYVDAKRRQAILERQQQQEHLRRQVALEEQRRKAIALEDQRQREAQARQRSLEQQAAERERRMQQQQRPQHGSSSRGPARQAAPLARQEGASVPIYVRPPLSPQADPQAAPLPTSRPVTSPSKPARTIEEQNAAASRIQQLYRIYSSSRVLRKIASEFENVKTTFVYPRVIDFKKPGPDDGHVSVPACRPPSDFDNEVEESMDVDGPPGKLAYTSTNYVLHQYADALVKLLMRLDGVESWGDKGLRMKRREVVKDIEKEASKLERYWKQAWMDYLAKQGAEREQKDGGECGEGPVQE